MNGRLSVMNHILYAIFNKNHDKYLSIQKIERRLIPRERVIRSRIVCFFFFKEYFIVFKVTKPIILLRQQTHGSQLVYPVSVSFLIFFLIFYMIAFLLRSVLCLIVLKLYTITRRLYFTFYKFASNH